MKPETTLTRIQKASLKRLRELAALEGRYLTTELAVIIDRYEPTSGVPAGRLAATDETPAPEEAR